MKGPTMRSPIIKTKFTERTSRYGSHMGTCLDFPHYAEAWFEGRRDTGVEITSDMYPTLEPYQLTEKAVALLRASTRRRIAK